MYHDLPQETITAIRNAIFAGQKILAIKLYRDATDTGLKESKEFIEQLTERLYEESPGQFSAEPNKSGCAGVLLAALGASVWLVSRLA